MVLQLIGYIGLALMLIFMMVLAIVTDRNKQHPYLGIGGEEIKIASGAVYHDCPDCGKETAVYESETGETICGNCGAGIGWSKESGVHVETPGDDREPYDWK